MKIEILPLKDFSKTRIKIYKGKVDKETKVFFLWLEIEISSDEKYEVNLDFTYYLYRINLEGIK